MQIPRAVFVMLAGLAAGVVVRMVFPPSSESISVARSLAAGAGKDRGVIGDIPKRPAGPRTEGSAILTANGGSRLRLLLAWLPGATEEELSGMADGLMRDNAGENLSIRLLMARWAEVNPAAMLAWADKQSGDFYSQNAIEAWARVDFDSAWAAACAKRLECRGSALLGLTAVDPDKCLRVLRADPSLINPEGFTNIGEVLARIAGHDPAGAASLLNGVPAARQSVLAGGIVQTWMKSDQVAAIAWLRTLTPAVRSASAGEAGQWLAEHAPEHIPALLEELPAAGVRTQIAATAFENLARHDAAAARQQLENMPEGTARQYCRALLMKELLRSGDEAGATALAMQLGWQMRGEWSPSYSSTTTEAQEYAGHGGTSELDAALGDLLSRVAARDPQQAAEFLVAGGGVLKSDLLAAAAAHDPAALASALLARNSDPGQVVSGWARKEPAAATAWAMNNFHDDTERARMVWPALSIWAGTDPAAVSRWAAGQSELIRGTAWSQLIIGNWDYAASHPDELFAANHPPAVSQMLEVLSSSPEKERAILRQMPDTMDASISPSVQRWLESNPGEASQWVRELPPGARRTNATTAMIGWLNSEGDREAAFEWATTLAEEKRSPLIEDTIVEWANADPNAAMKAVSASNLPPEEIVRWVNLLKEQSLLTLPAP